MPIKRLKEEYHRTLHATPAARVGTPIGYVLHGQFPTRFLRNFEISQVGRTNKNRPPAPTPTHGVVHGERVTP